MGTNREIIDVSVRGAGKAQSSLKKLGGAALKLGGAFFAAKGIVMGISTIVQSGSKLKSVEMAFDNMGKKVGFSEGSLKKLQAATDGTVSKLELMTKANNAMALGIVTSDDQMAEMFDTAQRLGKALGQDTASALDSLVTGMGRQSKLMLDNLGIMVDTEGAYEDYAKELGKTASQLTDAEKKQAFNNAAMAEATRIANEMGDEQLTTADKLSKLKNTFSDMAASVGSSADGMFSSVVDAAQGVATRVAEGLEFAKSIDWGATARNLMNTLGVIYEGMRKAAVLVFEFLVQNIKKVVINIPSIVSSAFVKMIDWLRNDLWPAIKAIASTLWDPYIIYVKIAVQHIKLKFQEMWNGIKQMGVDGVNNLIEKWNFVVEKFGGTPVQLLVDVPEDNVQATKDTINQLYEDMLETDLGGAIFGVPEDQVDTLGEFKDAMGEIIGEMTDQIIVQNEEIIESDNSVVDNKKRLADKKKEIDDKQREADRANFAEGTANFKTNLEKAGKEYKAFQQLDKAMKIKDILIGIPPTVRDAYASGMKAGGPFAPVIAATYAATAFAAQMAQLQMIKKAQYGADFVTSGPEMMMVGEAGAEQVSVTPLEGPNTEGPQGQGITLNISGNVMTDEFVESTLVEKIRESLRLGENMGV